ncbi:MAG TPA: trypsin-like peptidase domain-containing protein [Polyangiaceae bacterium]|nr:trypsin-like peptidase domain-containing protein [Polyangiaceae bacterium]
MALLASACGGSRQAPATHAAGHVSAAAHPLTVADIAARALPAVVTIRTAETLGTGFVVRSDGWIATNLHVIVGGPRVRVTLGDEREFDVVEVLAASPEHDLALLRVEARGLHTVPLGDSDTMRPGDPVVAIGNPLGLEDTVSNGLVSARRRIDGLEVLQVSAPIAPGSSGGPLFNERGEVIGVATAVLQGGQNLNFGVPVRYLAPMIRQPAPMPLAEFALLLSQLRRGSAPSHTRSVPRYPSSLFDGCPAQTKKLVVRLLGDAVDAGAPLFNDGKPDACYHMYDGAASDLVRKLPPTCKGPAKALAEAQRRAAALGDPAAQAWLMRDSFDAILDIARRP